MCRIEKSKCDDKASASDTNKPNNYSSLINNIFWNFIILFTHDQNLMT